MFHFSLFHIFCHNLTFCLSSESWLVDSQGFKTDVEYIVVSYLFFIFFRHFQTPASMTWLTKVLHRKLLEELELELELTTSTWTANIYCLPPIQLGYPSLRTVASSLPSESSVSFNLEMPEKSFNVTVTIVDSSGPDLQISNLKKSSLFVQNTSCLVYVPQLKGILKTTKVKDSFLFSILGLCPNCQESRSRRGSDECGFKCGC